MKCVGFNNMNLPSLEIFIDKIVAAVLSTHSCCLCFLLGPWMKIMFC